MPNKLFAVKAKERVLLALRAGPSDAEILAEELDMPQASVSAHLSVLRYYGRIKVVGKRKSSYAIADAGRPLIWKPNQLTKGKGPYLNVYECVK